MLTTKKLSSSAQSPIVPDAKIAKLYVFGAYFAKYSSSYIVTNEDLRHALGFMPPKTENALVVAASGDLPIFATLCGAKNVDTFDISYNAKVIMDIKTAAIHTITYPEYKQLLRKMFWSDDFTSIENMSYIIPQLPPAEQKYIADMRGYPLCQNGLAPDDKQCPTFLTSAEFYNLRKKLPKSFNFIWSDIRELGGKLAKKYDFVHLSNILDYLGLSESVNTLRALIKHTRPNCTICMECMSPYPDAPKKFNYLFSTIALGQKGWNASVIQRQSSTLYVMLHRQH